MVELYTQENPELVKKIAEQHPEFFVDGSIVEACMRAMPDDFNLKQIKYMVMEKEAKSTKQLRVFKAQFYNRKKRALK